MGADGPCAGLVVERDCAGVDVAYRTRDGVTEAMLVFVEQLRVPLQQQLEGLRIVHGAPPLPVVARSIDRDSVYDRRGQKFVSVGRRHRMLLKAFEDHRVRGLPCLHPDLSLVDLRPDLQLHVLR